MGLLYRVEHHMCTSSVNEEGKTKKVRLIIRGIGGGSRVKIEILIDSRNSTFNLSESFYRM